MKKTIVFLLLILSAALTGFSQKNKDLIGAWEMIYQHFETTDTSFERTNIENPSEKILCVDYFAFCAESGRGHAGSYTYDGKTYTEKIRYSYEQSLVDQTVHFESKMEGDIWQISGKLMIGDREVTLTEKWRRKSKL